MSNNLRRFHTKELLNWYAPQNIIRMTDSRRIRCTGHVAHTGAMRNGYNISAGNPEGKK
jgi:hypothetical protein